MVRIRTMKKTLFGIVWASAHNAIWFIGYAFLVVVLVYTTRSFLSSVRLLVAQRWQGVLLPGFSSLKSIFKAVLLGIGFLGLFLDRKSVV